PSCKNRGVVYLLGALNSLLAKASIMKKFALATALAAFSLIPMHSAMATVPPEKVESVLDDIGPRSYNKDTIHLDQSKQTQGGFINGLYFSGFVGGDYRSHDVDMWQNNINPRSGDYNDFAGEFGLGFRYYKGLSLGNSQRRIPFYLDTQFG